MGEDLSKIIPRWEWRTFGDNFGQAEDKIKANEIKSERKSAEVYILSTQSMQNTKIRDGLMDIKVLKNTNEDSLEQWMPVFKEAFPLSNNQIAKVFEFFKIDIPEFKKDVYSFDEFLEELIKPCVKLKAIDVTKVRHIYNINECIVEIAEVTGDEKPTRTVAVEQEDPKKVIETVEQLGLRSFENVNYIKALKRLVGMSV